MLASELFSYIRIKEISGNIDGIEITQLSQDNRQVGQNTAFICIKGSQVDGHDFVESAKENGAVLFVASEDISEKAGGVPVVYVKDTAKVMARLADVFYDFPSEKLYMVGITGTNGKTTTAHLIEHIFEKCGFSTGIMGTIGHRIGKIKIPTKNTTPDALTLQGILRKMIDERCDSCVMEVSSHAIVLDRVLGCNFDCAIFTNLTHEHLELHKTMENYAHTKQRLFLEQGHSLKNSQFKAAVINVDDKYGRAFAAETVSELITYSLKDENADFFARALKFEADSTKFVLVFSGKKYDVKTNLIGEFNVYNLLAAIAGAFARGIAVEKAIEAVADFGGVDGRMQRIETGREYSVIVDFAHTPDGLENALGTLNKLPHKNIITVIGHSGGNRDSSMRPELGKIALENSERVIFTADNPRHEKIEDIVEGLISACPNENYIVIEKREEAIKAAFDMASEGDIVLLAGKGGEPYQVIGDEYIPYDEAEVAKKLLNLN